MLWDSRCSSTFLPLSQGVGWALGTAALLRAQVPCGLAVLHMAFAPLWDHCSLVLSQMTPVPGAILSISVITKRSEISLLLLLTHWECQIHLTRFPMVATVPRDCKHFLPPPIPFLSPLAWLCLREQKHNMWLKLCILLLTCLFSPFHVGSHTSS